jgi:hypothetical protein
LKLRQAFGPNEYDRSWDAAGDFMPPLFEKRANSIALATLYRGDHARSRAERLHDTRLALSDVTIGRFAG